MMKTRSSRLKFVKDGYIYISPSIQVELSVGSSGAYGNGLRQTNMRRQDFFSLSLLLLFDLVSTLDYYCLMLLDM